MMTSDTVHALECSDASLVAESLQGDRDAFARIVERYQNLVSGIAYCATGNVARSEDLAQETFVTAWKRLPDLREPARLRSWLCGILRFLISKECRRRDHEPIHEAESLEALDDCAADVPLPLDHVISEEEKAILWRALEQVPEIYREPLVLFYREHQSIETVARDLELSEDAVKQRLARGRKLVQARLLAFVAGALRQTTPGRAFSIAVLAALPLAATSAKAGTITAAAGKTSPAAKAAATGGMLSAFLSAGGVLLFSLFGIFGLAGRWIGRRMGLAGRQSALGRRRIVQFWRALAIGFAVFVLPGLLIPHSLIRAHRWLFPASTWLLACFYLLVAADLAVWVHLRRQDARRAGPHEKETSVPADKAYNLWVTLGSVGPAFIVISFFFALFFSNWTLSTRQVPVADALKIASDRKDARLYVFQYHDGSRVLEISLPEDHRINLATPINEATLADLSAKGLTYEALVEDVDFHNGGLQGWMLLLSTFLSLAGAVLLWRRPGTKSFYQQEITTPRAEKREGKIFAILAGSALTLLSLVLAVITPWHRETLTPARLETIASEFPTARFEVIQLRNGSSHLEVAVPGNANFPGRARFIAPADDATLSVLRTKGIAWSTLVQGRDFGYADPGRVVSACCICLFLAAAAFLLWRFTPRSLVVFGSVLLLLLAVLLVALTPWGARSISAADAVQVLNENPRGEFIVVHQSGDAKELWIHVPGSSWFPSYIAPADDATITALHEKGITYQSWLQGRVFGINYSRRATSTICLLLLLAGAAILIRRAIKMPGASTHASPAA